MKDDNQNTEYDKAILEFMMETFCNLIDPAKIQEQSEAITEIPSSIQQIATTNKPTIVKQPELLHTKCGTDTTDDRLVTSEDARKFKSTDYIAESSQPNLDQKQKIAHTNTSITSHKTTTPEPFQLITPTLDKITDNSELVISINTPTSNNEPFEIITPIVGTTNTTFDDEDEYCNNYSLIF